MQALCRQGWKCLLGAVDVLLGQLGAVKPVAPAQVLTDEGNGHGCLIGVELGHVQVINKIDQLLGPRRAIVDTSLHEAYHVMHCYHVTVLMSITDG